MFVADGRSNATLFDQVRCCSMLVQSIADQVLVCGNCLKRPALREKCEYSPNTAEHSTSRLPIPRPSAAGEAIFPLSELGSEPIQHQQLRDLQTPGISSVSQPHNIYRPEPAPSTLADSHTDRNNRITNARFGSSSHSAFTNQIKAAIDLRSGAMARPQSPSATPLVDVPIFPSPHDDTVLNSLADATEYELPPRRQADDLVHTYWSVMHPLFPVPDRSRFMQSYNALFFGKTADIDERILLSTLNAIFAFAVQLHESTDRNGRERLSGKYFRRAQALLQLTVWEKGSIDLVQCLLLISQYLQCTNKPHQTWMTVGSAVRIAQSLGLHLTEVWSTPGDEGAALKRRVWQSCVIMDRYDENHPICHTKLILDLEQYALLMGDPQ